MQGIRFHTVLEPSFNRCRASPIHICIIASRCTVANNSGALQSSAACKVLARHDVPEVRGYRRDRLVRRERLKVLLVKSLCICPAGKMRGASFVAAIISFSNAAPILGDETNCKIVDISAEGIRIRLKVDMWENSAITQSRVAYNSGREQASASQLSFPGL